MAWSYFWSTVGQPATTMLQWPLNGLAISYETHCLPVQDVQQPRIEYRQMIVTDAVPPSLPQHGASITTCRVLVFSFLCLSLHHIPFTDRRGTAMIAKINGEGGGSPQKWGGVVPETGSFGWAHVILLFCLQRIIVNTIVNRSKILILPHSSGTRSERSKN